MSDETDPAEAKAMASSFWEVAIILSQENDETVRQFAIKNLLSADLSRKNLSERVETKSMSITEMIDAVDVAKEQAIINRKMLAVHGQLKRSREEIEADKKIDEKYAPTDMKRMRLGEQYQDAADFFALGNY